MRRHRIWKDNRKIRRYKQGYKQRLAEVTVQLQKLFPQFRIESLA